jgi:hypothetical protein
MSQKVAVGGSRELGLGTGRDVMLCVWKSNVAVLRTLLNSNEANVLREADGCDQTMQGWDSGAKISLLEATVAEGSMPLGNCNCTDGNLRYR